MSSFNNAPRDVDGRLPSRADSFEAAVVLDVYSLDESPLDSKAFCPVRPKNDAYLFGRKWKPAFNCLFEDESNHSTEASDSNGEGQSDRTLESMPPSSPETAIVDETDGADWSWMFQASFGALLPRIITSMRDAPTTAPKDQLTIILLAAAKGETLNDREGSSATRCSFNTFKSNWGGLGDISRKRHSKSDQSWF
jgi:hypothetical protein